MTTPAPPDTTPPSIPSIDSVIANSATDVTISWSEATDDVEVTGYTLNRDANFISTTTDLNYVDSGLTPFTSYSYTIQAITRKAVVVFAHEAALERRITMVGIQRSTLQSNFLHGLKNATRAEANSIKLLRSLGKNYFSLSRLFLVGFVAPTGRICLPS